MLLCRRDSEFLTVSLCNPISSAHLFAGSVVASRLSEIPHWKVLLIEAGGDEPTGTQVPSMFLNFLGSDIDWGYTTEPEDQACLGEKGRRCYWPRGKVLVESGPY
jgi:choline dehydrogenase